MTDQEKIAKLTGDAIRVSSEAVVKEIIAAAQTAERVAGDLRVEADQLVAEINQSTSELVDRINEFVLHCQTTSGKIREVRNGHIAQVQSELGKQQAAAPSPIDGRR